MRKPILFLLLASGIVVSSRAEAMVAQGLRPPSQAEYEAALVIVQKNLLEQEK